MSKPLDIPIWKTAPILRLLLPLVAGILLQWYLPIPILFIAIGLICFTAAFLVFSFLPAADKFKLHFLQGALLQLVLLVFGMLLTWNKDVRHQASWYGNHYQEGDYIIAFISEPLVEKAKSYKAAANIQQVSQTGAGITTTGKLLVYFSKDSTMPGLHYGDRILIHKKLVAIKNSGNPGAFNYQRYAAFQLTHHQVFLQPADWIKLEGNVANSFQQFLFNTRERILNVLQKNISSSDALGIAEALLIGYTNDLDKDLVQAYSNTGVVHIIAISGMHLGLIYGILLWLFARMPMIKRSPAAQAILILTCLWIFSLLTGGSASVIRSAVMFSFITVGRMFFKASSVYSSLAAAAFVMLCYNPYYLWDVGFQLSYLAVVGIVVFQKPIYNLLYIKNKYADAVWKATALTTAAQVLTFPVCIYYFHQFPLLFLITNLVAVPLSTLILYTEILLVCFSWLPAVAALAGNISEWLLLLMNGFILWINKLPFAVLDKLPANVLTTWLLYATVVMGAAWLLQKKYRYLQAALACLAGFLCTHCILHWQVLNQQKIIVYQVPKHRAIDFVQGNRYRFAGDSILLAEGLLQNFHLKPGRTALHLQQRVDTINGCFNNQLFYQFGAKKIVLIDQPVVIQPTAGPVDVDMIVVSHNPTLNISELARAFNCKQYVFDASNSLWKIEKWKQDCDQLHLRFHSIPEQGAFILDL